MRRQTLHCLALLAVAAPGPAQALIWGVDNVAQVRFDDNLFRRPGAGREHDRIGSIGSGLFLTLPKQALSADFEGRVSQSYFANNAYLDNFGYSLAAHATYDRKNLSIALNGQRERQLSDFSEIYENVKNMQTVTLLDGQADVEVISNIRAVIGGSLIRSENSSVLTNGKGYTIRSISGGVGYYSPSHNSIALLFQRAASRGLGTSPVMLAGQTLPYRQDFSEDRAILKLHYQPSALLLLDTQISYVDRHDRSIFRKDFSGLTGKIAVEWKPRRTVDIATTVGRRLQTDGYVYSDSVREDYASIRAKSRVTDRIDAKLGYSYIRRHFVYDTQAPSPIEPRTDHFQRIEAGLTYDISRRLALDLTGQREWRMSTNRQFRYADDGMMVRLHIKLGTVKPRE